MADIGIPGNGGDPPYDESDNRERDEVLVHLGRLLWFLAIVGLLSLGASQNQGYFAAVGIGVLIFATSFVAGGALGFLFALPRVMTDPQTSKAAIQAAGGAGQAEIEQKVAVRLLQSNTNLERISDWLTTMLVGVSLTQLNNLPRLMLEFRTFLAETVTVFTMKTGVQTAAWLPTVGAFLLIFGALLGFLSVYLYMRLVLVLLFNHTEQQLYGNRLGRDATKDVRAITETSTSRSSFLSNAILSRRKISVPDVMSLMQQALYKTKEQGFETTIRLGGTLVGTSAMNDATYWVYLACAFGQKHHWLTKDQKLEADTSEVLSAYDNTLDAVARAVRLDPSKGPWLKRLATKGAVDDDLQDFADDPRFNRLVNPRGG